MRDLPVLGVVCCAPVLSEFQVAMRSLGFPAKKKDVLAVLDEYNKDQHSMITEAEFRDISAFLDASPSSASLT